MGRTFRTMSSPLSTQTLTTAVDTRHLGNRIPDSSSPISRFFREIGGIVDSRFPTRPESGNRESPIPDSAGIGNRGPDSAGRGFPGLAGPGRALSGPLAQRLPLSVPQVHIMRAKIHAPEATDGVARSVSRAAAAAGGRA